MKIRRNPQLRILPLLTHVLFFSGVTNPFFNKALQHWPNQIRLAAANSAADNAAISAAAVNGGFIKVIMAACHHVISIFKSSKIFGFKDVVLKEGGKIGPNMYY